MYVGGMTRHICIDCGHWLGIGPANDTPEVLVEVRAAELAQDINSNALWMMAEHARSTDLFSVVDMLELAVCIADHDDAEARRG
jgi:hypothetical protein